MANLTKSNLTKIFLAAVGTFLAVGCSSAGSERDLRSESLVGQSAEQIQTAEDVAVLAFVNDQQVATLEVLDVDCALRSDGAKNILTVRDGFDGVAGTADDNLFDSVAELDGVPRVGAKTLAQLIECADSYGYMPTAKQVALVSFLNDKSTSFERLDIDCALRSDAAGNLIAHRDGPDGVAGTTDDDLFHSEAEVDAISRIGVKTMWQLYSCAELFGFWDPNATYKPIGVTFSFSNVHSDLNVSQDDGSVTLDHSKASYGAGLTMGFDDHELYISKNQTSFAMWNVSKMVPEGYGGRFIGNENNAISRFRITRDPAGTLSSKEALEIARDGLITFIKEVRMHKKDWKSQLENIKTWKDAVAAGIMEGIDGFGTDAYDSDSSIRREVEEYSFTGRGPLGLYTTVRVSKASGKCTYFYVEID